MSVNYWGFKGYQYMILYYIHIESGNNINCTNRMLNYRAFYRNLRRYLSLMNSGNRFLNTRMFQEKQYKLFIYGEYHNARGGKEFIIENPADGTEIAKVAEGMKEDIDFAMKSSLKAFAKWKNVSKEQRADILEKIGRLFADNLETFIYIESLQTGRPIREMKVRLGRLLSGLNIMLRY